MCILTPNRDDNATSEMALIYQDSNIKAACKVDTEIIDVEGNNSWECLVIHRIPVVGYIGKGSERRQKIRWVSHAEKN